MTGRLIAVVAMAAFALSGCRAPMPSFDGFAPFGSTRVPPPPTGAYKQAGNYYSAAPANAPTATSNPARTAPAGSATAPISPPPAGSSPPNLVKPPAFGATAPIGSLPGFVGVGNSPGGGIAPVSYQAPATRTATTAAPAVSTTGSVLPPTTANRPATTSAAKSVPAPKTSQANSSTLRLNGMHVNDATQLPGVGQVMPPDPSNKTASSASSSGNHTSSLLQIVKPTGTQTAPAASAWQAKSH